MLIIDRLKDQTSFTVTEKRIADYILQNITEIPHLYIDDLAKLTYTSRSAIIRLSKKLGYNGFRKFRMAISGAVHSQQHVLGSVNANFPFEPQDSSMEIAKKMSDLTIDTIKKSRAQLSEDQLTETVKLLLKAERIFLFAIGDSQLRARSFQNKLTKINKTSIIADEYGDEAWNAVNLTKKDCALFVSYSGKSKQYNKILRYFLEEDIPTILLTGNKKSDLVKLASLAIIAVQDEYDFVKVGTFSSQVSFEYILDTIFSIMYAKNYEKNLIDFKRKQSVLQLGILKED